MLMTSAQVPWFWVPLLGGIAGALCGGLSAILVGSTKAEKEERGKRRIDARKEISKALRTFRYSVSERRLAKFNLDQLIDRDDVHAAAGMLASIIQSEGQVLPRFERWRLVRDMRRILGRNLLRAATLRAPERYENVDDSALQAAIMLERQAPSEALFGRHVLDLEPTKKTWDDLLKAIDQLRRRFP